MKKRELRPVIAKCYKQVEEFWNHLAEVSEDDTWNFDSVLLEEPDSQLTKMVCWMYALDAALDSNKEATPFEIAVCEKLPGIIETLNDLAEDQSTF